MFALTFVPSLLQSIAIPFMPKSPRYLLIDLKQEDAARNGLFSSLTSISSNKIFCFFEI